MCASTTSIRKPVLLIILDGFGVNPCPINNGVAQAATPRLDNYFSKYPLTVLEASGAAVGLPDGQMGNSEVGHLTLGCGQIIRQDLVAIDDAIKRNDFYRNEVLLQAIKAAQQRARPIHLLGLVSDGGVHSHINHLKALIELARRHQVIPVLHMISDGRDTAPMSASRFVDEIQPLLSAARGFIASLCGRYYAMDRDNRWERVELAWKAIARAQGVAADSALQAIERAYTHGQTDEFIEPCVIQGGSSIDDNDSLIFFNYRKDRTRQLTAALFRERFSEFDREHYQPITVTCMTEYDEWYHLPYAFCQDRPGTTLAEMFANRGIEQLHCAETEKYAHVTYFFNGRQGDAFPREERIIVPSPKVATYDQSPAMSAAAVADHVVKSLETRNYGFIVVNFANGDMVGHTGVANAVVQSIEALDKAVGRVLDAAVTSGYSVILTADHGNCEEMVDSISGLPHTQHTVFPVPGLVIDQEYWRLRSGAGLGSIAPTVLQLMGIPQPDSMNLPSLLLGKR